MMMVDNDNDHDDWRLRFTSSENPYGFLLAAGEGITSTTTLEFTTTFADDTLRVVRGVGSKDGPLKEDEIFVFERHVAAGDDTPATTTLAHDNENNAYGMSTPTAHDDAPILTAESFSDIPDECELGFEEDGSISILCDEAFVEDAATVSD